MNREQHLLVKVSEECSEISQVACKAVIFGPNNHAPNDYFTNSENIMIEFYQLSEVIKLLQEEGTLPVFSDEDIKEIQINKRNKINRYMEQSISLGYTRRKRREV